MKEKIVPIASVIYLSLTQLACDPPSASHGDKFPNLDPTPTRITAPQNFLPQEKEIR